MTTAFHRLSDPNLIPWTGYLATWLMSEPARAFVALPEAEAYQALQQAYAEQVQLALSPQTRTLGAIATKRDYRRQLLAMSRRLALQITSNIACTDDLRINLDFGIRAPRRQAIPVPTASPIVLIGASDGTVVPMRIIDTPSGGSLGRDHAAAQVFTFIGEAPPAHDHQWHLAATTTRSRIRLTPHRPTAAHTLWITCRFLNRRAQPGPCSDPRSINLPALGVLPSSSIGKLAA